MMYLLYGQSKVFVRQIITACNHILFAEMVGAQNELKKIVSILSGHDGYGRYSLYTLDAGESRATYKETLEQFHSQPRTFYKKIDGTGFYELVLVDSEMYRSLEDVRYGINKETSEFFFVFKGEELKDCLSRYTDETNRSVRPLINTNLLFQSKVFQDALFQRISLSCSIPVLKEWIPLLLGNSTTNGFIDITRNTGIYWDTGKEERIVAFNAFFSVDGLKNAIKRAFQNKIISFGNDTTSGKVLTAQNLTAYLSMFGDDLVQKAHNRFNPLYVPGISKPGERAELFFKNSQYYGNLNFFDSQKDVTSSIALSLDRNKRTIVVGECGVGKTAITLGSVYAHTKKRNPVTLIMAPGHMVEKWNAEIQRLYPFAQTWIISDIQDVLHWEKAILHKKLTAPLFLIVGKDACKMEYEKYPYLTWDSRTKCYIDPTASHNENRRIYRPRVGRRNYAWSQGGQIISEAVTYFAKQTAGNQYVPKIINDDNNVRYLREKRKSSDPLQSVWSAANPDNHGEWVKVSNVGWINTKIARDYVTQCDNEVKNGAQLNKEQLKSYMAAKSALTDAVSYGVRRCNISEYIRKRVPLDYFIADEVHLYSSKDTAQGKAFGNFLHAAQYTVALTGTLLNGYAQNVFAMLFRMYPHTFIQNGFRYNNMTEFAKRFGVVETTKEFANDYRGGRYAKRTTEKFKPGVSPLLFSKFLLDKAVFVTLADITSDLPNYEEVPVGIDMDLFTKEGYEDFYRRSQELIAADSQHLEKYIFKIVQRMNQYPDQPYDQIPIFNNDTGEAVICPNNVVHAKDFLSSKDRKTLELVQQHMREKEKVLIYVNWVNASDCVDRLLRMFEQNQIKAAFLTASVSARQREKWIQDKVKSGIDVLICNPSLVETGLDLLDFTTIIFYQLGYNLFTMRQASRRSLRLNQSRDVTVYFLYFNDTIQESIVSLMANKLQAAMAIEGKFSEEGLNAMSENDTLLTQLANNLTKNIEVKLNDGAFDFHTIKAQTSGNRFKEKAETMMKNWYFPIKPVKKGKEIVSIPDGLHVLVG